MYVHVGGQRQRDASDATIMGRTLLEARTGFIHICFGQHNSELIHTLICVLYIGKIIDTKQHRA